MKVLHADDHPMFREGMKFFLKLLDTHITILEASSFPAALDKLTLEAPVDLAIIDLQMPGMSETEGFFAIRRRFPKVPVVILSGVNDTRLIRTLLDAGARGFIPKFANSELLLEGLRRVLQGEVFVPDGLFMPARQTQGAATQEAEPLTSRQLQILPLLADGMANKEIAETLGVTEGTIKQHMKDLFKRLHTNNRTQAVQSARRLGLLRS